MTASIGVAVCEVHGRTEEPHAWDRLISYAGAGQLRNRPAWRLKMWWGRLLGSQSQRSCGSRHWRRSPTTSGVMSSTTLSFYTHGVGSTEDPKFTRAHERIMLHSLESGYTSSPLFLHHSINSSISPGTFAPTLSSALSALSTFSPLLDNFS